MHDQDYFVLIKPIVANPSFLKGHLFLKRKLKQMLESMVDRADPRNLFLAFSRDPDSLNCNDAYDELNLFFEDGKKAFEVREKIIEEGKRAQLLRERDRIETFIKGQCEPECNNLFS